MSPRNLNVVSADPRTAVLDRARALVPVLAARAADTERLRRVPDETIADFHRSGLFRVLQPKRFGGHELDFAVFATITRELARGCASSAWVYCVIEELFWVLACFPEEAQTEIWGEDPAALACAALLPTGTGVKDGDGYRVNGEWGFLSGSDHAAWVFLTAACDDGKGGREIRNFFVRASEVQFIDDWHVIGLAGTGSKSCKVDNLYVPAHRSVRYDDLLGGTAPGRRVHPQYSLCRAPRRYLTTFSITPVLVGLANRALELTTDMLRSRVHSGAMPNEFEVVQQKVAESAAEVATANLILRIPSARQRRRNRRRRRDRRHGGLAQPADVVLHGAAVAAGDPAAHFAQRLALGLQQPPDAGDPARRAGGGFAPRLQLGNQRPRLQPEHRHREKRRAAGVAVAGQPCVASPNQGAAPARRRPPRRKARCRSPRGPAGRRRRAEC